MARGTAEDCRMSACRWERSRVGNTSVGPMATVWGWTRSRA